MASEPAAKPVKRQGPGSRAGSTASGRAITSQAASRLWWPSGIAGRGEPSTAQSISAQREMPATASASARKPRRRSSSRRQQRSTAAGRARKAGSRSSGTQPARGTGEAQALAAMAIQSAGGSRRPEAPSRRGSCQGGPVHSSSPSSETAARALAGEAGPQANVPHQAPNRARSRGGARPAIVRHCRR